jgi:hypothetical protein
MRKTGWWGALDQPSTPVFSLLRSAREGSQPRYGVLAFDALIHVTTRLFFVSSEDIYIIQLNNGPPSENPRRRLARCGTSTDHDVSDQACIV